MHALPLLIGPECRLRFTYMHSFVHLRSFSHPWQLHSKTSSISIQCLGVNCSTQPHDHTQPRLSLCILVTPWRGFKQAGAHDLQINHNLRWHKVAFFQLVLTPRYDLWWKDQNQSTFQVFPLTTLPGHDYQDKA